MGAVAKTVSTLALLASSIAQLGMMQAEGALFDSCRGYSFVGVSFEKCQAIGAAIVRAGEAEQGYMALAVSKGRAECCTVLGLGAGALYALLFLSKGGKEVVAVHLMEAVWGVSVCLSNAQNAGLLPVQAEANLNARAQAMLVPFVAITGAQALLHGCALLLCVASGASGAKDKLKAP